MALEWVPLYNLAYDWTIDDISWYKSCLNVIHYFENKFHLRILFYKTLEHRMVSLTTKPLTWYHKHYSSVGGQS